MTPFLLSKMTSRFGTFSRFLAFCSDVEKETHDAEAKSALHLALCSSLSSDVVSFLSTSPSASILVCLSLLSASCLSSRAPSHYLPISSSNAIMMKLALLAAALPALSDAKAVRRDWATLSQEDKDTFGRGVNMLKDSGWWDQMVHDHRYAFELATPWINRPCPPEITDPLLCPGDEVPDTIRRNAESKGPAFLPFHRQLVLLVEKEMQRVLNDPDWGVPYWNYANDAEGTNPDPKSNPMWGPNGLGSDGRPEDGVVVDGPFAYWPIKFTTRRPFNDPRPPETMLERTIGKVVAFPSVAGDLEAAWNQTVYDGDNFDAYSSVGVRNWLSGSYSKRGAQSLFDPSLPICSLHCQAHGFIGGTMLVGTSPNDPAFFLLHSFTDGTWYQWQNAVVEAHPGTDYFDWYTPKNSGPEKHNIDDLMGFLNVTPRSVLDVRKLDYVYEGLPTLTLV